MLQNFDSWRKAKMASVIYNDVTHYFKLADGVYYGVSAFFRSLLSKRFNRVSRRVVLNLSDDDYQLFLDFLTQSQFGYIHPRSSSGRYLMVRESAVCSATPHTY